MRFWYLSHCRVKKAQTDLHKSTESTSPSLQPYTKYMYAMGLNFGRNNQCIINGITLDMRSKISD